MGARIVALAKEKSDTTGKAGGLICEPLKVVIKSWVTSKVARVIRTIRVDRSSDPLVHAFLYIHELPPRLRQQLKHNTLWHKISGSPYKAVQVIKKHVITTRNVLILLGHGFVVIDVTY